MEEMIEPPHNFEYVNQLKEKNILIIGKKGVGKSTIVQILLNSKYDAKRDIRYDVEKTNSAYHTLIVTNEEGEKIALNIIDTPGLFYVGCDNNALLKQSWELMEKSIRQLNAIVLVLKFEPITDEDVATVRVCQEFFGDSFKNNTVVVFTCTEKLVDDKKRLKNQLEFTNSPNMKMIKDFCQGRFLLMGAEEEAQLKKMYPDVAKQIESNIESLRHYFLKKIISFPPVPLPENLIFQYNSMVQAITKKLTQHCSKPVQDELLRLINQRKENEMLKHSQILSRYQEKKEENQKMQNKWNIIDEINILTAPPSKKQRYNVREADRRNILLIGGCGNGKSTLVIVLQFENHTVKQSMSYKTRIAVNCPLLCEVENKPPLIINIINIIDTPGLDDLKEEFSSNDETRSKDAILYSIETCLQQSVTEIHAVLYIHRRIKPWSKNATFQAESYEKLLGSNFQKISWFVVTQCEGMEPEELEDIKSQCQKEIPLQVCREGRIELSGVLDQDEMSSCNSDYLPEYKQSVAKLRSKLIERIRSASVPEQLPSMIMDIKSTNLQSVANQIKSAYDREAALERQQRAEIARLDALYPKDKVSLYLITANGKFVCSVRGYLYANSSDPTKATEFYVQKVSNDTVTLRSSGKAVDRSGLKGWFALWGTTDSPMSLQIIPIGNTTTFNLKSIIDNLFVGYDENNESKGLCIKNGPTPVIFQWRFL